MHVICNVFFGLFLILHTYTYLNAVTVTECSLCGLKIMRFRCICTLFFDYVLAQASLGGGLAVMECRGARAAATHVTRAARVCHSHRLRAIAVRNKCYTRNRRRGWTWWYYHIISEGKRWLLTRPSSRNEAPLLCIKDENEWLPCWKSQ